MLTIWGRINSHNVKKVVWIAEEIGLPYQRHDVGGAFGMDAAYLARNPNALIPTIEDGAVTLWESNAILRYLAATYAPGTLWPDSPAERAVGDKWMDWVFTYADAQRDAFKTLIRTPEAERDMAAVATSAKKSAQLMAILDAALAEQPWLSGDSFGIGDIPMGVYARTWFGLDIERPAFAHVERWYARLEERPAFQSIAAVPLS